MRNELMSAGELVREKLELAQDLARQVFEDPSAEVVMELFNRLCVEADQMPPDVADEVAPATLH